MSRGFLECMVSRNATKWYLDLLFTFKALLIASNECPHLYLNKGSNYDRCRFSLKTVIYRHENLIIAPTMYFFIIFTRRFMLIIIYFINGNTTVLNYSILSFSANVAGYGANIKRNISLTNFPYNHTSFSSKLLFCPNVMDSLRNWMLIYAKYFKILWISLTEFCLERLFITLS